MKNAVSSWLTRQPSNDEQQNPASLLADWKAYASSRPEASGSLQAGRDLEASVPESLAPLFKSANETVLGTFNIVSKGVRDLPGNVQSAASSMPSGKALLYFGILLATGIFFIFIALTMFLPVMVVMPRKFAICFTLGCLFIILSFFALKGPKSQLLHMASKERLPLTIGFVASMAATIYVSMVLRSYLLSVVFSVIQVLALLYYLVSYFPGGSAGMRFLSSRVISLATKCVGR
eukprot:Gb_01488 [translate_table: standard]